MTTFETIQVILAALVAGYEILARLIPTNSRWSIIGKVLEILQKISDALDKNEVKKRNK